MQLLAGTDDGLFLLTDDTTHRLNHGRVSHLAVSNGTTWIIVDGRVERIRDGAWKPVVSPSAHAPRSLLPMEDRLYIGTSEAQLYRSGTGEPILVDGFEKAEGRDRWHTPWGGPPDTRSLAQGRDGRLYANVHVGGVLRSLDGERWEPTLDIESDVHEVVTHPELNGCVLVASAWGLGLSFDGAESWQFMREGLHNPYARAVAASGEIVLMSASDGPRGGRAALYRRPLRGDHPFERCSAGLPEWFTGNIDTGCLAADGFEVAFGTADGAVFTSTDGGASWSQLSDGLAPVRAVAFAVWAT